MASLQVGKNGVLVDFDGIKVNEEMPLHRTPLHAAALYANEETVKVLLNANGINVNQRDMDGRTPLHLAAKHAGAGVIMLLVNAPGIKVNEKCRDFVTGHRFTPLHIAVKEDRPEIVEVLLTRRDIDVKAKTFNGAANSSGGTALSLAHSKECKKLLKDFLKRK